MALSVAPCRLRRGQGPALGTSRPSPWLPRAPPAGESHDDAPDGGDYSTNVVVCIERAIGWSMAAMSAAVSSRVVWIAAPTGRSRDEPLRSRLLQPLGPAHRHVDSTPPRGS